MAEYQSPKDHAFAKDLVQAAPTEAQAFLAYKKAAEREEGVIPIKYRELISLGVALRAQCAYCIEVHTKNARDAGATREEIAEVVFISSALSAGAVVGHGLLAMRLFSEATSSSD